MKVFYKYVFSLTWPLDNSFLLFDLFHELPCETNPYQIAKKPKSINFVLLWTQQMDNRCESTVKEMEKKTQQIARSSFNSISFIYWPQID